MSMTASMPMRLSFILLFAAALHLGAMDRFAALSMIEIGDRDNAHGPDGEVTRFQISPAVLAEFGIRKSEVRTEGGALAAAERIMEARVARFAAEHHRPPTPFEWYLLWHRPAVVLADGHRHPMARELERAQRFANLVQDGSRVRSPHRGNGSRGRSPHQGNGSRVRSPHQGNGSRGRSPHQPSILNSQLSTQ